MPKQHSTGGKPRLGSISRRGNAELRSLLTLCANSMLVTSTKKTDKLSRWAQKLCVTKNRNVVKIAIANKLARIVWSLLAFDEQYDYDRKTAMIAA